MAQCSVSWSASSRWAVSDVWPIWASSLVRSLKLLVHGCLQLIQAALILDIVSKYLYTTAVLIDWIPIVYLICMLGNFVCFCCRLLIFFRINFFKQFFQEYHQSVKQLGSSSGLKFCWVWSGSILFTKIISGQQVATSRQRVNCLPMLALWLTDDQDLI